MITRVPTSILAATPNPRIASIHRIKQSKAIKLTTRIPLQLQHQLRQYSSPPKTYFQPGDPFNPNSQTPNSSPSPPLPPKTYFQPLDSQNVAALGPDSQIYNIPIQPPPKKPRSLRTPIFAASFLFVGLLFGTIASLAFTGDTLEPGSEDDQLALEKHQNNFDRLPIVQSLSNNPDFEPCELKEQKYIQRAIGGTRGVALRRTFLNRSTGQVVTVIRFGKGTAGWPTVAHGGVTATVISEVAAVCAELYSHDGSLRAVSQSVDYKSPVSTLSYYVISAMPQPRLPGDGSLGVFCTLEATDNFKGGTALCMSSAVRFEKSEEQV